ncbi:DinB family protein [Mucilaginibacter limnophilus]|uniref:DinB family protein n=1 Tax=Mucilaginibacter limnophilus TaxID=1932778 RepID=A0A3S3TJI9_9SPHI|nr:DinB family protein [Mucilaginibacter limnophilus]RVU02495.1 DinB family protein [Mucilaginibacter limnophilus]
MQNKRPEVWQRGPIEGIPPLLQPVAHALLQAAEEIDGMMDGFPAELLYEKSAGMASPAFHLLHLTGVLDRLFTYARGEQLTPEQLTYLSAEGQLPENPYTVNVLTLTFNTGVKKALEQLSETDEQALTETRLVGRAQIPSTVIGLYVHAAEHTMRHIGQLLVTINVIKAENKRA